MSDLRKWEAYFAESWNRHDKMDWLFAKLMLEVRRAPHYTCPADVRASQFLPTFSFEAVQEKPAPAEAESGEVKDEIPWERIMWCARLGLDARTGKPVPDYQQLEKTRWIKRKEQHGR